MHNRLLSTAAGLSDAELLRQVVLLAERDREATVELVGHLAELDARKLHLTLGYGSLFSYCTGALHLAEHAAYNRIEAARLSRRFPALLDLLADGSLNLSTARLLGPHLRPDNFEALVAEARGRSKRDVEVLVARLSPQPDVAASVRQLPARAQTGPRPAVPRPLPALSGPMEALPGLVSGPSCPMAALPGAVPAPPGPVSASPGPMPVLPGPLPVLPRPVSVPLGLVSRTVETDAGTTESPPAVPGSREPSRREIAMAAGPARPTHRPVVTPLAPKRYRVQFTIGAATHEKLRRAQELLRREIPDGDPGAIFDRALTLLCAEVARKKLAVAARPTVAAKPRLGHGTRAHSRHIPARVKRAVWLRDGGRCAFVALPGRRCTERVFLEFHHREPHAIGGEATVANISLRCRAHNVYEAQLAFGLGLPGSAGPRSTLPGSAGPRSTLPGSAGPTSTLPGSARAHVNVARVSSPSGRGPVGDGPARGAPAGRARRPGNARAGCGPGHLFEGRTATGPHESELAPGRAARRELHLSCARLSGRLNPLGPR
jgi:hypothetical protein